MTDPRAAALTFEAVKIAMRQTKEGHALNPGDPIRTISRIRSSRTRLGSRYQEHSSAWTMRTSRSCRRAGPKAKAVQKPAY